MPQIVSISSLKGGVGKTSVTLGLTSAALARGLRTLVVDLDPHGDASTGLGVPARPAEGVGTAASLRSPRKHPVARTAVPAGWLSLPGVEPGSRLDVVLGSSGSSTFERLEPNAKNLSRLRTALAGAQDYDLVLVDCPPSLNTLTMIGWAASEKVLAVAEPSLFSVAGTERTMRAIARFETHSEHQVRAASVVVNKVREDSEEHRYRIEEMQSMFGPLVVSPTIPEFPEWQQVQGSAYPIHLWPRTGQEMRRSFDAILTGLLSA